MKSPTGKELEYRRLWLKPATGLTVINPETGKPLPAEGDLVAVSKYWRRRLNDGDVIETGMPQKNAPATKPSKKEV